MDNWAGNRSASDQDTVAESGRGMIHELKIQKEYAQAVYLGEKTFEVRINDRGYQKGDLIKFKVMDGQFRDLRHPLNDMTFEITYVLGSFVGLAPNYVAFAIRDVTKDMKGADTNCTE